MGMMIFRMSAIVAAHVALTLLLFILQSRLQKEGKGQGKAALFEIGAIYGFCAILSNHFGVAYEHSVLNIRDLSPLTAGLFFHPLSGIIAGLIGGFERYIVGTYFGIGSFTTVACSISTCLAGVFSAVLSLYVFKRKKPASLYAFFMGAVMEVFHMYMVFLTHQHEIRQALSVVRTCSGGMIFFTAFGLMLTSMVLRACADGWKNFFQNRKKRKVDVSQKFMKWMFVFTFEVLLLNFLFSFQLQTRKALENAEETFIKISYDFVVNYGQWSHIDAKDAVHMQYHVGENGSYYIISGEECFDGTDLEPAVLKEVYAIIDTHTPGQAGEYFRASLKGESCLMQLVVLDTDVVLLVALPLDEVFDERDTQAYETVFANIIMLALLYILVTMLVQKIVVDNLETVNRSLDKITNGNLQEEVSVYDTREFASLSDDINRMVDALKGYIHEAEKRFEQELKLSRSIQESSLPHNFSFTQQDFEIYATMDPAKQVGGDFYDFFFVGPGKLALVMADVSGKGIPAALFMMRSKAAIRTVAEKGLSPGQILKKVNQSLKEGNTEGMFVTVWIGIVDLYTGQMTCSNAGHEYPILCPLGKSYEVYKDRHAPIIGLVPGLSFSEYTLELQEGDCLFLYTDGIPEATNEAEELYGLERLKSVLNRKKDAPFTEVLPEVLSDIQRFSEGKEQFDDITMLGFRFRKSPPGV